MPRSCNCYVTGLGFNRVHNPHDRESAYTKEKGWGPRPGIRVFGPGGSGRGVSVPAVTTLARCADDSLLKIFQAFWEEAKANIYPVEREKTFFNDANYQLLLNKARKAQSLPELTASINEDLQRMEVSHTQFYDSESIEFYLFRSMFSTRNLAEPVVNHIGIQSALRNKYHVIREVLDGYPAHRAGIRRGDVLLEVNGKPYHPYHSFNPSGGHVTLEILRNGQHVPCPVNTVKECPNQSFYNAMHLSKKILSIAGKRIGYVHLWAGTHQQNLTAFAGIGRAFVGRTKGGRGWQ